MPEMLYCVFGSYLDHIWQESYPDIKMIFETDQKVVSNINTVFWGMLWSTGNAPVVQIHKESQTK